MDKFLKFGFAGLAVLAFVFGVVRIGQTLKLSFVPEEDRSESAVSQSDKALDEIKQKLQDSDGDGLNDWDELNVYATSPYLADTDSDKVNDNEEVQKNTDPNCPAGKECGSNNLEQLKKQQNLPGTILPPSGQSPESDSAEELRNLSPAEIREILKQGGVTDEQLQGATDEDLRKLLEEVVNGNNQ